DVFIVSPAGSGKALTFWIPLLFNHDRISIIVTPLNILGEKNCNEAIVHVPCNHCHPERILMDTHFKLLWKSNKFAEKLFNVTCDEGHCISEWGKDFRPLYSQLGDLRWCQIQFLQAVWSCWRYNSGCWLQLMCCALVQVLSGI
ncbi:hypothetical protein PAXRUDRAFT_167432, partial [Paxillus rubicundulus Ve08.2h10]